jgi:hypothetical protein
METAKRVQRTNRFGSSARFYDVDGTLYPSVTTILGVIGKPALVGWAAKVEREACISAACDLWESVPTAPKMARDAYQASLVARIGKLKASQKLLSKAGDIGSQTHALIEWWLRRDLKMEVGEEPKVCDPALWAAMAWQDWAKIVNMAPMGVEQRVWSRNNGYAGTLDLLAELTLPDGSRGIVVQDNKTGKAIYKEARLQVAALGHCLVEMEQLKSMPWGCIVRLPKVETDPAFEVLYIEPEKMHVYCEAFSAALHLWKWSDAEEHDDNVTMKAEES